MLERLNRMSGELRRRLKMVDPNLNIVPSRGRRKQKSDPNAWENSGGLLCPICGKETVRLVLVEKDKRGCPDCYKKAVEKQTKLEASLSGLLNSRDKGMARRARHMLKKSMI